MLGCHAPSPSGKHQNMEREGGKKKNRCRSKAPLEIFRGERENQRISSYSPYYYYYYYYFLIYFFFLLGAGQHTEKKKKERGEKKSKRSRKSAAGINMNLIVVFLLATTAALLCFCSTPALAANMTLKVKNDKRRVIDFGVFGYGGHNDGVMEVKVLDFLIHDLDEYESVDEKIGFALDLVPSAAYARKERKTAIKRTKDGDKAEARREKELRKKNKGKAKSEDSDGNDSGASSAGADDQEAAAAEDSPIENICFVDDPSFTPETRYLLPLQESLARIGRRVEKNAPPDINKMQKATALRNLAKNLTASISIKVDRPGYYALFFYNCKKANRNKNPVPVTFRVKISQYNVIGTDESGQYNSFLPYGETRVPEIYQFVFIVFAALTTVWHIVLYGGVFGVTDGGEDNEGARQVDGSKAKGGASARRSGGRSSRSGAVVTIENENHTAPASSPPPAPKLIHKLMYALLILKCLSLFFETVMLKRRRATGKLSAYVDFIFYGFQAVKGFFLFTIILLLGSGWSLLKPFLSERDRKLLLLLLPLQLIINVAIAVIDSTSEGSRYWSWWRDTLRLADLCCCVAVLLPVITSIYSLRSTSDKAEQRRLGRLRQFRTFYLVLVSYMFITRVMLDYVASSVPYNLTWLPAVIGELGALFLYVVSGYMFRPAAQAEWDRDEQLLKELQATAGSRLEQAEEIQIDFEGGGEGNSNKGGSKAAKSKSRGGASKVYAEEEAEEIQMEADDGDRLVGGNKGAQKKSGSKAATGRISSSAKGLKFVKR